MTPQRMYSFEPLSVGKILDRAVTLVIRQHRIVVILGAIWAAIVIGIEALTGGLNSAAVVFGAIGLGHAKHSGIAPAHVSSTFSSLSWISIPLGRILYLVLMRIYYCEYSCARFSLKQISIRALRAWRRLIRANLAYYIGGLLPFGLIFGIVFLIAGLFSLIIFTILHITMFHANGATRTLALVIGSVLVVLIILPTAALFGGLITSATSLFWGRLSVEKQSIRQMLKQLYKNIFSRSTFKRSLVFGLAFLALLIVGMIIFYAAAFALYELNLTMAATIVMNIGAVVFGVVAGAINLAYYVDYRIRHEGLTNDIALAECETLA